MIEHPAAIVTGSSRGIGRAIAMKLAETGHAVLVNFVRSAGPAEEVATAIREMGMPAIAVQGDVSQAGDRRKLIEAAQAKFGRIDVLVNNAGIAPPQRLDLLEMPENNWDLVLDTNLKAPFFLSQAVAKAMIAMRSGGKTTGGFIINISSVSAYAASTHRAEYCIAKAGLRMATKSLALRLAGEGVQVFDVCPGIIETDMTGPVKEKYNRLIEDGLTPIRRWGQPTDIANAVAALVSGAFPFSTGSQIDVDGGFHIQKL